MESFVEDFKKLNPTETEERAREMFKIIKVPNLREEEKKEEEVKQKESNKEPEKTPEELLKEAQDLKEAEEAERKKLQINHLNNLINYWNKNLSRVVLNEPTPMFPLNPITRRLLQPSDILYAVNKLYRLVKEPELPMLLIILLSDSVFFLKIYGLFMKAPVLASSELLKFFIHKKMIYNIETQLWAPVLLPNLRIEYINSLLNQTIKQYPIKLDLNLLEEKYPENIIDTTVTLEDLISKLKKNNKMMHKITDNDLLFFKLNKEQIFELRVIFGETNKLKQTNMVKLFLKEFYKPKIKEEELEAKKIEEEKEQVGGNNDIRHNDLQKYSASSYFMM